MTTNNQPSTDKPVPMTFDYRAEYLRIRITAQNVARAAERTEQCAASVEMVLTQVRLEGDPQSIAERERVTTQVRQKATSARQCAKHAEAVANRFAAEPPEVDSLEARMQTRAALQEVLTLWQQAKRHQDESSRLSGVHFAS